MNLDVAIRAVRVLRIQVMLRTRGFLRAHPVRHAVTRQTELRYAARNQQPWVGRTVWRMTRDTTIGFDRRVFVNKWSLFVCVTLHAGSIGAGRESCLLELKTAMWIVAVAALHCSFQHLVMERQIKLVLGLAVATQAKLRLTLPEQLQIREAGLLCICSRNEYVRGRELASCWRRVG